jgi:hypothetical protein
MKLSLDAFLSDVEKRLKAATPGPWELHDADGAATSITERGDGYPVVLDGSMKPADQRFVAHAPQDVAGLVAVVRAVLEKLDELDGIDDPYSGGRKFRYFFEGDDANVVERIRKAMESAVPGSESQNDDEAQK